MSSPCRSAAAIIARRIVVATNRPGGKEPALILPLPPAVCGSRRILFQTGPGKSSTEKAPAEASAESGSGDADPEKPIAGTAPNDERRPIVPAGK